MGYSVIRDSRQVPQKARYWRDDYQHPACDLIGSPSVCGVHTFLYKGMRGVTTGQPARHQGQLIIKEQMW